MRPILLAFLVAAGALAEPAEKAPPRRVASLNLAADEVLVELLPPERLVAVTALADEKGTSNIVGRVPRTVQRLPKADLERLMSLAPDLVVVSEYTDADVQRLLQQSGIQVHRMTGLSSLPGYRQAILDLGRLVGEAARAERLVARYDAVLAELARKLAGAPRPRVLYWAGGLTVGADTAIGALIECGGGANVGRELSLSGIAPIGAERAFLADPDLILVGVWPGVVDAIREHPLLSQMRAVRSGLIVEMPAELLVALSQHAADACWDLAFRLHPDRVARPRP